MVVLESCRGRARRCVSTGVNWEHMRGVRGWRFNIYRCHRVGMVYSM